MKKLMEVLFGLTLVVVVLSIISPGCRNIFMKHIPAVGHEVVSMTEDLAGLGMDEVKLQDGKREVANRVINDVADIANAGFDYFATGDEACFQTGTRAADDIIETGMNGLTNTFDDFLAAEQ